MTATPEFHPLSAERHGDRHWRRVSSYGFAAQQPLLPLAGLELFQAALALPVAFVPQDGGFSCVAVVGTRDGECLYVAPDGRWLAGYMPAKLRSYPFGLAALEGDQFALCMDEASGLLSSSPQDEPFFQDGKLAPALQRVLEFLGQIQTSQAVTQRACAALQTHGLLKPWAITLQDAAGAQRKVEGLFCVDEAALNKLEDSAFLALRRCGALALAYAQLMSMSHIQALGTLAGARDRALAAKTAPMKLPTTAAGDLDLSFMEGDTLRFS